MMLAGLRRVGGIGILSVILALSAVFPAAAQGGGTTTNPAGGMTIHVVQRDETMFGIAMLYGTTVDDIAEANGIADPRYIAVGQRLLIPNAHLDSPGAVIVYSIKPGDTLPALALRYHTTAEILAAANYLTNPLRLYVGQDITINQGVEDPAQPIPQAIHYIQPGENLARVALRYHVSLIDLLRANQNTGSWPVFPGQKLWIPAEPENSSGVLQYWPPPFTSCTLTPIPAVQGQTISLHLTTQGPATLSGTFLNYPVQIVTQDATQHSAAFGIHPFTAPGIYPLVLTAVEPSGVQSGFTLYIRVDDGGYGAEEISLDTQQQDLLTSQVTEPEWEKIARIMSTFTSQRYFDGLMGLPSAGAITSEFGTRRTYNGGVLNTFHSGTDFGGATGAPVLAPAAGVVVLAESLPVRGNATIIDHGWGVVTGYWHQSEIYVAVGDVVTQGQIIGAIGSTGRVTGPHLHWEMWVGGVQVDPMQWVRQSFP
ncbi:MAG: LysM peptidoglycan-binding domain-containing protein [Chloroflexi bacterium]|nr:LysM peptidoglycan-binding domain-containing protein [Chloroflexota bacterium]